MTDEPTDIVTRLRGLWQDNDCISTLMEQAADEIELLRKERDEARREVCNNEAKHLPTMADPHMEAKRRGWDCFKENSND